MVINMNDTELRNLQLTQLEILKLVKTICSQNNLTYYLVGGTLLGAVRHNGFIPWDDDLDIAMLRSDYNKFIDLCKNGVLGEEYFLHHTEIDPNYWLPFAKIKKNNTLFDEAVYRNINTHKGIFIDIFPLDFIPKNYGIMYHLRAKIIKKISLVIIMKKVGKISCDFVTNILDKLLFLVSIKRLARFRDLLCARYSHGRYIISYGSNYKYTKQTMPFEYYKPATPILFEGELFYAPNKYIKYLEHLFKNWEELPPKEERRNHNPTHVVFDTSKGE